MFGLLLLIVMLPLIAAYLHQSAKYGQRSYGDLEFHDDHPRVGPREQLLALFIRQNRWWAYALLLGGVVGVAWGFALPVVSPAALVAWCALSLGLFAKVGASSAASAPASQPRPIAIPLLWMSMLVASGLFAALMPVAMIVTGQPSQHLAIALQFSAVGFAVMVVAHLVQVWVRRRDFATFAGAAWNHSLRTLFVAHMLIVSCLAGYVSCLLSAFTIPQIAGFVNTRLAVSSCIWGVFLPLAGIILLVVFARGLRRALHDGRPAN